MEYSIYINQVKAVEWDLSMTEAVLFSYLVNGGNHWMRSLTSDPEYKWASNSKLMEELPLVCTSKVGARRYMATLEDKGLIVRQVVGNRSYFKITDKGYEWKSGSLSNNNSGEKPSKSNDAKPINSDHPSYKADQKRSPRPINFDHQSDIPISNKPINKKTNKKDAAYAAEREVKSHCVDAYHRHIHWGTQVHKWTKAREVALRRLLKNHPETRNPNFWDAYFQQAALDKFIRGEIRPRQSDADPFKANIDYLLREQVYVQFYERSVTNCGAAA